MSAIIEPGTADPVLTDTSLDLGLAGTPVGLFGKWIGVIC